MSTLMVDVNKLPRHIAIIMDGNGRWAKDRGLPRIMGHRSGAEAVREVVKACAEIKVPYLTLYAFSQENWKRPPQEVALLMELLEHFIESERARLIKEGIAFRTIGRTEALPPAVRKKIQRLEDDTREGRNLVLIVALNYGSRGEITDAARSLLRECAAGRLKPEGIDALNEKEFARHLYTAGIPDPDILIRTSGEMRLSNFLLWQCSYSEIYISKKYWPDFGRDDLIEAVREFGERERRFGAIGT